jgi:hypothetical protein
MVVALLRSRFHRVLSGALLEIRYRGRTSGRWYSLPAQYAIDPEHPGSVVVYPGHPERKIWWHTFLEGTPAIVVVRRKEHDASGSVVLPGTADRASAVEAYRERFPKVRIAQDAPLVVFTVERL